MTDWSAARTAWEGGASNREAGELVGVSRETLRKRAVVEGWQRQPGSVREQAERRVEQTAAATAAAKTAWLERQGEEADAAGVYAVRARQAIREALDAKEPQMVRAAAVAYGILIDKAQLLSGGSTSRAEVIEPVKDAEAALDELAQRRLRSA